MAHGTRRPARLSREIDDDLIGQDDDEWPDAQQCHRLGLHFDTGHAEASAAQTAAIKPPKSLITVRLS